MHINIDKEPHSEPLLIKQGTRPPQVDAVALVERFLDFNLDLVRPFLKRHDLPHTGIKEDLRHLVQSSLKEKILNLDQIQEFVDEYEPYSRRHMYFIKGISEQTQELLEQKTFRETLRARNSLSLIQGCPPFRIPSLLRPSNIEVDGNILRIKFTAPSTTSVRRPELDTRNPTTNLISRISEEKNSRKLYVFELNLKTGKGFVSIPAIQRGQTFPRELRTILNEVYQIVGLKNFEIITIGSAIQNLMEEEKSISRSLGVRYATGDTLKIKSPKKGVPVFASKIMKPIENHSRKGDYFECDFYYDAEGKKQFRFMLYEDERLGIMSDLDEEAFRDVIKLVLGNM